MIINAKFCWANLNLLLLFGILFASFLFYCTVPATFARDSVNFPGALSEIKSPNGQYTIKSVDRPVGAYNIPKHKYDDEKVIDNHYLLFLGKEQKKKIAICTFDRNVDVLWAPDSSAFVVNDWVGSNVATPYFYRVDDLGNPVDIGSKFVDAIADKRDKHSLSNAGCLYIFASRWISSRGLEIKAAGHNGEPFTLTCIWDLQDKFQSLKRKSKEDLSSDVPLGK